MSQTVEAVFDQGVFRPVVPNGLNLAEGQRVRLTVEEDCSPDEILALAAQVYEGLTEAEIDEIERIALDSCDYSDRSKRS